MTNVLVSLLARGDVLARLDALRDEIEANASQCLPIPGDACQAEHAEAVVDEATRT